MVLSQTSAERMRKELRTGRTSRGVPLSADDRQTRILKLRRRVPFLSKRYRIAELARIRELESLGEDGPMEAPQGAPEQRDPPDDLYIMRYVGILQDVLKIGRSTNPETRRRGIEASQDFHVELLATFPGYGYLETDVHKRLAERRSTRGPGREWFRVDLQSALETVAKAVREHDHLNSTMAMSGAGA